MPSTASTPAELADILRWYQEVGADAILDETPHDRLAEGARETERRAAAPAAATSAAPAEPAATPRAPRAAALSTDEAVVSAREQAATATSLAELERLLEVFEGCSLKATATRLVFADGNPQARLMLVGEAPGAEEDRTGKPFVGPAGQLLDHMLAAIGLDRQQAYVANVVPWRPPGNRTPTPQETAICLPFIRRQIALAAPEILVCLGGAAAQTLLGIKGGIMSARGRWLDYELAAQAQGRGVKALAMLHPAYLLRNPALKRVAWRDLRTVARALEGGPEPRR